MDEPRTLEELRKTHRPPPPGVEVESFEQPRARNYVRDLVLGYSDGLVSVFAAVAGVAGALDPTVPPTTVLLSGIAFGVAGALSMGLGEYLSTKSQAEYYESEAQREREHIRKYRELELEEVREILEKKGYPPSAIEEISRAVVSDEERFVDFMMREEFGVGSESQRNPWAAMGLIMVAFVVGSLFPVAPFALPLGVREALLLSVVLSVLALALAGALKAWVSGLSWIKSSVEMVLLGGAAAAITYGVGSLVGSFLP